MDPHVSRLVRPVTEYSATQGSSGVSCGYWPGMDTSRLLLALEQGLRSLEDYIREYLEIAYYSDLPDCVLIDLFCEGIDQPLKLRLTLDGPRSSLSDFMDHALMTVGSAFTVGVTQCFVFPAMVPETMNALPVLSVSALPVLSVSALPRIRSLPGFPAQSASLCWSSAPPRWSSAQVWWSSAPPWRSPALSAPHWWAPALSAPPWRLAVLLWSSSVPPWWSSAEGWWSSSLPWWSSAPVWWFPAQPALLWRFAAPPSLVCSALVGSCLVCSALAGSSPVCSALMGSGLVCSALVGSCLVYSALVGSCIFCSTLVGSCLGWIQDMPRGLVHVTGSERCVLSRSGSPPSQIILEICIRRGGISIQVPAVWAIPSSPQLCMMHGCGSLRSVTDGNPYTQLPRRLAHSGPVAGGFDIAQDDPPQPIRLPGAQVQLFQEHTVTQPTSFVPEHSYRLSADDSNCLSGASHVNSAPHGLLQGGYRPSTQSFTENAGPYGSGFACTSVGSASHATCPVLAEAEGSIRGLASQMPPRNGDSGLCISPGPLEEPLLAKARRDPRCGAQKECCHDRRFQQGLGSTVRGQTDLRPLFRRGVGPAH